RGRDDSYRLAPARAVPEPGVIGLGWGTVLGLPAEHDEAAEVGVVGQRKVDASGRRGRWRQLCPVGAVPGPGVSGAVVRAGSPTAREDAPTEQNRLRSERVEGHAEPGAGLRWRGRELLRPVVAVPGPRVVQR